MRISISLSGPPRGKGRARAVSIPGVGARLYSDPATVKYETQLRFAGTQAMAGRPPIEGPVQVVLWVRFPIPESWSKKRRNLALSGNILPTKRPDVDNIIKLIGDGLNMVTWRDDAQIADVRGIKIYSDRPGMTIEIDTLPLDSSDRPRDPLVHLGGVLASAPPDMLL